MTESDNFERAVELISKSRNVLITAHEKPDGDACGSIVALCEVLRALGKDARPLFLSSLPGWYEFLPPEQIPVLGRDLKVEELMEVLGRFGGLRAR